MCSYVNIFPRVSVIVMCACMICGGGGYILCYQNMREQILPWILLSTTVRSLYGWNGAVIIATSAAVSHGYEGRILQSWISVIEGSRGSCAHDSQWDST